MLIWLFLLAGTNTLVHYDSVNYDTDDGIKDITEVEYKK